MRGDARAGPGGQRLGIGDGLVGREDDHERLAVLLQQFLRPREAADEVFHLFGRYLRWPQGVDQQDVFVEDRGRADHQRALAQGRRFDLAEAGVADLPVEGDQPTPAADVFAGPQIDRLGERSVQPGLRRQVGKRSGARGETAERLVRRPMRGVLEKGK